MRIEAKSMKELDSFTVEQLNNFIESDHAQCGDVAALARIALAAKMAEPEWYIVITSVGVWQARYKTRCEAENHIKPWHKDYWIKELYTAPQLNSPEIPDERLIALANHIQSSLGGLPDEWQSWADEIVSDLRKYAAPEKENG